jgi:LysM domain
MVDVVVQRATRVINPTLVNAAQVSFIPVDSPLPRVTVNMSAPPERTPANPTYDTVSRPFRAAVNRWTGFGVETQTLMVMFSGPWNPDIGEQDDITGEVVKLESLAIPPGGTTEPPLLRLEGPGVYGRSVDDRWQIQSVEPKADTLISRDSDGRTAQVEYSVVLTKWYSSEVVTFESPAAKAIAEAGGAPAGQPRTYTVVKGDVLSRIAQRELGNANRWKEIADLNGIRDPNKISPGQILKLP